MNQRVSPPLPDQADQPRRSTRSQSCTLAALKACDAPAYSSAEQLSGNFVRMSLATLMLEQLAVARRIIEDGQVVVPAWRIASPEGTFLIFTPFDTAKPEQRENAMFLISRFMAWKMATSFVFTGEPWLGADGEDALHIVGVSLHERLAVVQRIKRGDGDDVSFSQPMWLARHHVDDRYIAMLPRGETEITTDEAAMLTRIFGKDGELAAERLS
jgi:hypothetical protein